MSTSGHIKGKKKEKALSTGGTLKDLRESGIEYVDRIRKEDLFAEEKRSKFTIGINVCPKSY